MNKDAERVLISKERLEAGIKALAKKLDQDYEGKNPLMICILKGSSVFFSDLIRAMEIDLQIDFMAISSYGAGSKSSGEVRMIKDIDRSIENRDVIIVEDIIDSGYTLTFLKKILYNRAPNSVKICTLLDKPSRREVDLQPDYKCFEIENEFVIGYGLDYNEKYRNIPEVCVLKREVYSK